jgi:hypothetical protein
VFKPGDIVRHRTKPEWGPGRVTGQTVEGKVLIKFSARAGDVLLTAAGAEQHLELANDANWQQAPRAMRRDATVGRVPCSTCAVDVREPVTRGDGTWQACPQCSAQNGKQHVLRPYPEAFVLPGDAASSAGAPPGTNPAQTPAQTPAPTPATTAIPDDPDKAAWCLNCRSNGRIPVAGFRVCAEFAR